MSAVRAPIFVEQVPLYRLKQPFYDCPSSTYVAATEELEWDGEPNEFMEALNEAARIRLQEFYDRIDSLPRRKNPTAQAPELADAIVTAIKSIAGNGNAPQVPEVNIRGAAEQLGVDPEKLAALLGIKAAVEPGPADNVLGHRRQAEISPAEMDEVEQTTRKRMSKLSHLKVREPVSQTRGRPKKIMAHVEPDAPILGSI